MFKDMGNEIDKKMSEYKKNIDEYKEKLGIDEILKDYEDTEFNLDEWFKEKGKILTTPKVKIGLVNKSTNDNPEFATNGASGFDLRADLPKDKKIVLDIGEYTMIPTGLYFEIPEGFEIQVRPRSGLAAKNGVTVLNSPGTVDCVPKGTLISTPDGELPVEELFNMKSKKLVYSFDEDTNEVVENVISDMWVVNDIEMLEILTEEGDSLKIPKTKEVFTDSGWVLASSLTTNHKILKLD